MKFDECIKRVEAYLDKNDNHPRVVNINDVDTLIEFKKHFNVGNNRFLDVETYSLPDENPSIDKLFNDLSMFEENVFIVEFSTCLKLKGDIEVTNFLNQILHSSFNEKVVLICYQCSRNLEFSDDRLKRFIYKVDSKQTKSPDIHFIEDLKFKPDNQMYVEGIEKLPFALESCKDENIYVKTKKNKNNYKYSLYSIFEQNSPFKILCSKDTTTNALNEDMGTNDQWLYALEEMRKYDSWNGIVTNKFGTCNGLENFISNWRYYDKSKKWIYFIALKINGVENNWCLDKAIRMSETEFDLKRNVYRCLFDEKFDFNSEEFWKKYLERKNLIKAIGINDAEINSYCNLLGSKKEKQIYFITDNTKQEKELIFKYLYEYAEKSNYAEIMDVLEKVYPDLFYYLSPYWMENELLYDYFKQYKYQKVINKIFPEFKDVVEKQAIERNFNLLPARASKIEEIDKKNSALYFVDAMGVEFLQFLLEKCNEKNLLALTQICICELPSLTMYNKGFIEEFDKSNCLLVGGKKGIKKLDEIKHDGINGFNYENTKLPIHLIEELEVIKNIVNKIDTDISQGLYDKAVIISDHGASRLAVINENENKWEMQTKGEHSGRCCPRNEIDDKPDFAIEENGYWVLANYDRFKGGRKSDVEVHGGASLEEVLIPIIEITRKEKNIELQMITKEIKFNIREKNACIEFYSSHKIYDVIVEVDNNRYKAITSDNKMFKVPLSKLKKAKNYKVKVYSGNNLLSDNLEFIAKKEGFEKRKLF